MKWSDAIAASERAGCGFVIATVLATSGSAPRPAGTKMVITREAVHDTIGGGQFEWLVIERARQLIAEHGPGASVQHFPLAAAANQCCGGSVTVLLEHFPEPPLRVAVFGAGHIGRRVVRLLADLPAHVQWFDSRPEQANEGAVTCQRFSTPVDATEQLHPAATALVLTHDHLLDFELVDALLRRGEGWVGLIGSETKRERFIARLRQAGHDADALARLVCPIGIDGVDSKAPMAIAVSIVADLLKDAGTETVQQNELTWRQIRQTLVREGD